MATTTPSSLMTVEEFLALPDDDDVERMLIDGKLWETSMTKRNRWHSWITAQVTFLLRRWLDSQPEPHGAVMCGEAGFILRREPAAVVGIDVVYVAPEVAWTDSDETTMIEGKPVLAVEVLSPSDKQEDIAAKVQLYLDCGVPLVWVVDPHFQTVVVYRPDSGPQMFHGEDGITGGAHLPDFRITVAEVFRR